jgi:endonuclease YncB( thermonuclease family)
MVYGKVVEVKVMATDRYGRTVAMIYADKTLLNEETSPTVLALRFRGEQHCKSLKEIYKPLRGFLSTPS